MENFNLYGPLNDFGYGIFTRGIISGLLELGENSFSLSPIGPLSVSNPGEMSTLQTLVSTNSWNRKNPSIAIWHEFDLNKFSSNKLIAYPIFETDKFNKAALNYLPQMDAIFVLSSWAKDVVISNIGDSVPVYVVPGASDEVEKKVKDPNNLEDTFTFFSAGKYEQRKSPVEALTAYVNTFSDKQADTRYICHCFNPFDRNFVKNMETVLTKIGLRVIPSTNRNSIIGVKGNAIVEVPKAKMVREDLLNLMSECSVGIFPARAEGWNLPLMETIKSGTPCIATNYSAHTEYLTEEFKYPKELLLNNLTHEIANDGQFFKGDRGGWMRPSVEEISEKMDYVYSNYSEVVENFNKNTIAENFTWKNSATKLLEAIKKVND
jgi:hypothetical protein